MTSAKRYVICNRVTSDWHQRSITLSEGESPRPTCNQSALKNSGSLTQGQGHTSRSAHRTRTLCSQLSDDLFFSDAFRCLERRCQVAILKAGYLWPSERPSLSLK